MIWQDILVERVVSASSIQQAIVKAGLADSDQEVQITYSLEAASRNRGTTVFCEVYSRAGQFPLQIGVYLHNALPANENQALQYFANAIGERCLATHDSPNPYLMRLFTPFLEPRNVYIDAEAYDERDELNLIK